jgi:uncharacterized low-complexity protein
MKKANINSKLTIAGALLSGMLMIALVVGFTTEKLANNDNSIENAQLSNDTYVEMAYIDGKCDGDKDAEKKSKDEGKAQKKNKEKSAKFDKETTDKKAEAKCGDDKAKEGEGKCGDDKAKEGESKCGDDKAKEGESKCGEGKCGEGKCGM